MSFQGRFLIKYPPIKGYYFKDCRKLGYLVMAELWLLLLKENLSYYEYNYANLCMNGQLNIEVSNIFLWFDNHAIQTM